MGAIRNCYLTSSYLTVRGQPCLYVKEGQAGYAFTAAERGKIEDEGTICLAIFLWDHVKKPNN